VTHDAHLFRAICLTPTDDGPRFAFAEFLDKRGGPGDDALAGCIRQIEQPYVFSPGQPLYLTYQGWYDLEFDAPLIHPQLTWAIRRGFVCAARAPLELLLHLMDAERLCARCPIEWVEVTDHEPMRYSSSHYLWKRDDEDRPHEVGPRVFAALAGHPEVEARDDEGGLVSFPTPEAALRAVSWAVVNIGREVVGFPPLAPITAPA
jgi:uncharacterized protein (TIGR02996 family)